MSDSDDESEVDSDDESEKKSGNSGKRERFLRKACNNKIKLFLMHGFSI